MNPDPTSDIIFLIWQTMTPGDIDNSRALEGLLSRTSRATSPPSPPALSSSSMARSTKELRWTVVHIIIVCRFHLTDFSANFLTICWTKVKPYVLDDQLCDECQGGRYLHREYWNTSIVKTVFLNVLMYLHWFWWYINSKNSVFKCYDVFALISMMKIISS